MELSSVLSLCFILSCVRDRNLYSNPYSPGHRIINEPGERLYYFKACPSGSTAGHKQFEACHYRIPRFYLLFRVRKQQLVEYNEMTNTTICVEVQCSMEIGKALIFLTPMIIQPMLINMLMIACLSHEAQNVTAKESANI